MAVSGRIHHQGLARKVVPAEEAAGHIRHGDTVGMSGFTGAGYPKAVPQALAQRIHEVHAAGEPFRVNVWTGASTAPELDGALAAADGIELRLPYQSDPVSRDKINRGLMEYIDVHLSHVAQMAWMGFLGPLDVAIVETSAPDRNSPFKTPDADSRAIAGHIVEFLEHEVARGRVPGSLLPLQSGVGNVANAVLAELGSSSFEGLTAYTEVIQDGMLDLLSSGSMVSASATAFSLSPEGAERFDAEAQTLRERILLRPQEISNHPEIIRRLGVLAMNGLIEADIYGNVNSTHVMGSRIQNGIGGSGDFAP